MSNNKRTNMTFQIDSIENPIGINKQIEIMESYLEKTSPEFKKILILPPDYTRKYSGAGKLTGFLYDLLKDDFEISMQMINLSKEHLDFY